MSLSPQFLDELRARTSLSGLIGASVKLTRAGSEQKGCCPFHHEKSPSFFVNDDKGFYHCFGCSAHGDAIRWLTESRGLDFIDAVKQLAEAAGMAVPAPSAEVRARAESVATAGAVLEVAQAWYAAQLAGDATAQRILTARGVGADAIRRFGLGYVPSARSVGQCGADPRALVDAGLLFQTQDGLRDRFRQRIMIPIHDARGRPIGFGGRATSDKQDAKYINSAEGPHFDKGRTLYNLHRAAPAARVAQDGIGRRLIVVEGYFDVIGLDSVGIAEAVAPMGTALTEAQLERLWRVHPCPVLLFDGDKAGRAAALRACERAMPMLAPGSSLSIAVLAEGDDPDSLAQRPAEEGGGRAGVEAVLGAAQPLAAFVWNTLYAALGAATPERRSGLWQRLATLAKSVRDEETRAGYLADWRARFDLAFPPLPPGLSEEDMLPDGSVGADLAAQGEGVQAALRKVAGAWLERQNARRGVSLPKEMNGFAFALGGRMAAGLIDFDAGEAAFAVQIDRCPTIDLAAAQAAFWAGVRKVYRIDGDLLTLRCAGFERTDLGNAERFRERYGEDFLYTTAKGWLGYDGRRYRVLVQEKDVTPAEVLGAVFATVRGIQDEARMIAATGIRTDDMLDDIGAMDRQIDTGRKKELLSGLIAKWGRSSESSGRLGCIANLAKRWLTVEITAFDTDPMLLNCHNGTLEFHRGEEGRGGHVTLREHRRADLLTKLAACAYDPEAEAPEFQKLVRWAQPKSERRRYLRQWAGYSLTGDMGEQIFHIWWGPTAANGKSTVGNALRESVGDYGDITNVETFLDDGQKKRGDQATPDIVRLPGVRFLTSGEPAKGSKINEALINSVTGGDPMLARDNFRSFFRFSPAFKWTMWCNAKPEIPQGTEGIWRRVKVLLWESHLEPDQRDRGLPDRLKHEYAGILAWSVRGLIDWMDNGFVEPDDVKAQSAAYRDDSDPLASFLRMCTIEDAGSRVQSSHLYDVFCAWAKAAGEAEWKQKGFSRAMKDRGFDNKQSNGMQWLGLKLIRAVADFVDEHGKVRAGAGDGGVLPDAFDRSHPPPDDDYGMPP